jgi:hypothetical protein
MNKRLSGWEPEEKLTGWRQRNKEKAQMAAQLRNAAGHIQ